MDSPFESLSHFGSRLVVDLGPAVAHQPTVSEFDEYAELPTKRAIKPAILILCNEEFDALTYSM